MDSLQQSLEDVIASLPALVLEQAISNKLKQQGVAPTKALSEKLAKHILSGNNQAFKYRGRAHAGNITLSFNEADANEITQAIELCQKRVLELLPEIARRFSKKVLKDLKSRWTKQQALESAELSAFRKRLEERWGKPLGQLRMLLAMSREWCQWVIDREDPLERETNKQLRQILIRMMGRGLQVTEEIICLLENGLADGAMARWRTLHEIAVVAAVISQHGESIAERYIAHQAVESKRALDKYLVCCKRLGYRPISAREQKKIVKAYDHAVARYGKAFKSDYGWAASHLKKDKPTFADLELAAGKAEMRAHYQMGNDNIHAGIKSMFVRLGLLEQYVGLLAGRSNAGLTEPGQNAAHTLTQLAALVCLSEPNLDDLVAADMLRMLRDEIPRSLGRADRQLRKDDKKYRAAVNAAAS